MSPLFGAGLTSPAGVPKATVTGTTGSPTVNTNARAGKTIYEFNGSGSITIGTAGSAEILVVGGGGGGGAHNSNANPSGGGGGAAVIYNTNFVLPAGTLPVTIGAGGQTVEEYTYYVGGGGVNDIINSTYTNRHVGTPSMLGNVIAIGGGSAGYGNETGKRPTPGGSGGGAGLGPSVNGGSAASGYPGTGQPGGATSTSGNVVSNGGGGGGGYSNAGNAGAAGSAANGSGGQGGTGGNGLSVNITGSAVVYGSGGGGGGGRSSGGTYAPAGGAGGTNGGAGGNGGPTNNNSIPPGTPGAGGANNGSGGGGAGGGFGGNGTNSGGTGGSGKVVVVIG